MFKRALAIALASTVIAPMAAAETTLVFATASPPEGRITTEIFTEWVERVNEDGAGVVQIDMRPGFTLASPTNFYDRVSEGVVPITWGILSVVGGQFPRSMVVELPFLTEDTEVASVAFWQLYEEGALDAEYQDVVPLFLTVFPQSGVHLREPLPDLDELHGARVILASRTQAEVIETLGGTPLSISPADAYEAIQRGTADGRLISWTGFQPFRMDEITSYHIEVPFGTAVGAVLMNRDAYEALDEEAREVLMRRSGEEQTRALAVFFRGEDERIRNTIAEAEGHTVVSPSEEQMEEWRSRLEPIWDAWVERTPDGEEVLARYQELLDEAAAE